MSQGRAEEDLESVSALSERDESSSSSETPDACDVDDADEIGHLILGEDGEAMPEDPAKGVQSIVMKAFGGHIRFSSRN